MNETSVGFTGSSRNIPAVPQAAALKLILCGLWADGYRTLEHGEAENADTLANSIARAMGYHATGHPSAVHASRTEVDEEFPADQPLRRNHTIVDRTSHLIAMPGQYKEVLRSGTWATVRYARRQGRTITFIWPDGSVTREGR